MNKTVDKINMEEKELLQRALNEITSLRQQNEKMRDRLDMFDNMMCILYGTPGHANKDGGMAPDIAYEIRKRIEEINSQQQP